MEAENIPRIIGRFFFAFGITVTFAVLVSLFVSFTLDPMLSSRWVDPDIARVGKRNPLARLLDRFDGWFDRTADRYRTLIGWALDYRWTVVGSPWRRLSAAWRSWGGSRCVTPSPWKCGRR